MSSPNLRDIDGPAITMDETQFYRAVELTGMDRNTAGVVAAKLVLVDGMSNTDASKACDVTPPVPHRVVTKLYRAAWRAEKYVQARMECTETKGGISMNMEFTGTVKVKVAIGMLVRIKPEEIEGKIHKNKIFIIDSLPRDLCGTEVVALNNADSTRFSAGYNLSMLEVIDTKGK